MPPRQVAQVDRVVKLVIVVDVRVFLTIHLRRSTPRGQTADAVV